MKNKGKQWMTFGLLALLSLWVMGSAAMAVEKVYSPVFSILESGDVQLIKPELTEESAEATEDPMAESTPEPSLEPPVQREVKVTCEMGEVLKEEQEFTLKAELMGYEGVEAHVQWQYDNGMDEDGDGHLDGWQNAPGQSDTLSYAVEATEETLSAQWRVLVTIAE